MIDFTDIWDVKVFARWTIETYTNSFNSKEWTSVNKLSLEERKCILQLALKFPNFQEWFKLLKTETEIEECSLP